MLSSVSLLANPRLMGEGFNDDNDFHCYICFKPIEFIESLNPTSSTIYGQIMMQDLYNFWGSVRHPYTKSYCSMQDVLFFFQVFLRPDKIPKNYRL